MSTWKQARSAFEKRRIFKAAYEEAEGNRRRIAEILGVCRQTVSRILHGHLDIDLEIGLLIHEDASRWRGGRPLEHTTTKTVAPTKPDAPPKTVAPTGALDVSPLRRQLRLPSFPDVATEPVGPGEPGADRKREITAFVSADTHRRLLFRVAERKAEGRPGGMGAVMDELVTAVPALEAQRDELLAVVAGLEAQLAERDADGGR